MKISNKNKKILKENSKKIRNILLSLLVLNLAIFLLFYFKSTTALFLKYSIPEIIGVILLMRIISAKTASIRSISSAGLPSFYTDLIFFGTFCKFLRIWFKYSFLIFILGILISGLNEVIYKPYGNLKKNK